MRGQIDPHLYRGIVTKKATVSVFLEERKNRNLTDETDDAARNLDDHCLLSHPDLSQMPRLGRHCNA